MKNVVEQESEKLEVKNENVVRLPLGLLGFEEHKEYVMLSRTDEAPFLWMQMLEPPRQGFLMLPPAVVKEDYQPELSEDDVDFLGLHEPGEALVFNIVTLHNDGRAAVNLKGPIVINRHTLTGKQVIPQNAAHLSVQHPVGMA